MALPTRSGRRVTGGAAAALVSALLLSSLASRAAAQAVCNDFATTLTSGSCDSVEVPASALTTANMSTIVWTPYSTRPTTPANDATTGLFTFLAGANYTFTASVPTGNPATCSGSVKITPCVPECSGLELVVNADRNVNCTYSPHVTEVFNLATIGKSNTGVQLVNPTNTSANITSLSVGTTKVYARVNYAGLPSQRSICELVVTDSSNYTAPPTPLNTTCFYRNSTIKLNSRLICIPTANIASAGKTPSGKVCASGRNQFLAVTSCEPAKKCTLNNGKPTSKINNMVCVKTNKFGKSISLKLKLQAEDRNGALIGEESNEITVTLYKRERSAAGQNCVAVGTLA